MSAIPPPPLVSTETLHFQQLLLCNGIDVPTTMVFRIQGMINIDALASEAGKPI